MNWDPERAENIDKDNRVRLIRAIEVAKAIGTVPKTEKQKSPYDLEIIYLDLPDDELKKKIHNRNIKRLGNGLIEEVEHLHQQGLSWERMHDLGLEYRYVAQFVQRKIESKEGLLETLDTKIWQYAKRQRTWFKKYLK